MFSVGNANLVALVDFPCAALGAGAPELAVRLGDELGGDCEASGGRFVQIVRERRQRRVDRHRNQEQKHKQAHDDQQHACVKKTFSKEKKTFFKRKKKLFL